MGTDLSHGHKSPTLPSDLVRVDISRAYLLRTAVLILAAAVVAACLAGLLGGRDASTTASANGYDLKVDYPQISRGGLPTEWRIQVTRPGGISAPLTVAVTRDYLDMFDLQTILPEPALQAGDPQYLYFSFERSPGGTFDVSLLGRTVEALDQVGSHRAEVVVLVDGTDVVRAAHDTVVVP